MIGISVQTLINAQEITEGTQTGNDIFYTYPCKL